VPTTPRGGSTPDPGGKMPPSTAGGTPAATDEKRGPAELRLKTELKRLEWEVPNYNSIIGNTFLLSLFTGGIGGGIYISTSTSVNGFAVVRMELAEVQGGRVLLNQEYSGFYTEKMAKASCDTSTTKACLASQAFKDAMAKWKNGRTICSACLPVHPLRPDLSRRGSVGR
jgi:hypothetical protein